MSKSKIYEWVILLALIIGMLVFALETRAETVVYIDRDTQILTVSKDGKQVLRMRVIIGKPSTPTPSMETYITHVITNPTWTVPRSIVKELVSTWKNGRIPIDYIPLDRQYKPITGDIIDWDRVWTFRQRSGPQNVLGLVKFNLAHKSAIFLHDTQTKHLFAVEDGKRRFSHGCIRLEKPLELAKLLGVEYNKGSEKWHKIDPVRVVIR